MPLPGLERTNQLTRISDPLIRFEAVLLAGKMQRLTGTACLNTERFIKVIKKKKKAKCLVPSIL